MQHPHGAKAAIFSDQVDVTNFAKAGLEDILEGFSADELDNFAVFVSASSRTRAMHRPTRPSLDM